MRSSSWALAPPGPAKPVRTRSPVAEGSIEPLSTSRKIAHAPSAAATGWPLTLSLAPGFAGHATRTPGVPTRIELSVHTQRDKPRLDLQAALKARLAFDPGRSLALDDLALEAKGTAAGITTLALKATGSAMANVKTGEFTDNVAVGRDDWVDVVLDVSFTYINRFVFQRSTKKKK